MSQATPYARYRGTDRRGVGRGGSIAASEVPGFVESRYKAGWRTLVATVGADEVGRIGEADDGHRTWWADMSLAAQ